MPARGLPAAPGGGLLSRAGGVRAHTRAPGDPTGGSGPLLPFPRLAGDSELSRLFAPAPRAG